MKSLNLGKQTMAVVVLLLFFFTRIFCSLILLLFSVTPPKNQILLTRYFLKGAIAVIKVNSSFHDNVPC